MFNKNSLTKNKYPSQSIGSTSGLHILGGTTIAQCACSNGTANYNGKGYVMTVPMVSLTTMAMDMLWPDELFYYKVSPHTSWTQTQDPSPRLLIRHTSNSYSTL